MSEKTLSWIVSLFFISLGLIMIGISSYIISPVIFRYSMITLLFLLGAAFVTLGAFGVKGTLEDYYLSNKAYIRQSYSSVRD